MNRGDAQYIELSITIDGVPITEDYPDEIELTFNPECCNHSVRKLLSDGGITWNELNDKFQVFLTQADTFTMKAGCNSWQIRVLKDDMVISSKQGDINLGETNSRKELGNAQTN